MSVTKPAGCALQLMGAVALFLAIGLLFSSPIWGILSLMFAGALLKIGREPATR